jgi:small subunit ribosomal protein S17e
VINYGKYSTKFYQNPSHHLVEDHGEKFTDDFEHNKQMVQQLTDVESKKLRNWIAGYVTRYRQRRVD